MTSLIAISLLAILTAGGVLFFVATRLSPGKYEKSLAALTPALVPLLEVFAVYVAAWLLSALLANQ